MNTYTYRVFVLLKFALVVFLSGFILTACGGGGGGDGSGNDAGSTPIYIQSKINSINKALITNPDGSTYVQTATVIQSNGSNVVLRFQNDNALSDRDETYTLQDGVVDLSKVQYSPDSNVGSSFITFSPEALIIPADLETGATASSTSTILQSPSGSASTYTRAVTVLGTESVTVPAGTFQAIKIKTTITSISSSGTMVSYYTDWRADGVGRVKRQWYNAASPTEIFNSVLISKSDGTASATNVTGYWTIRNTSDPNPSDGYIQLSQNGSNVSGAFQCGDSEAITGTVSGNTLMMSWIVDSNVTTLTGTLNGNIVSGSWQSTSGESGTWSGEKVEILSCGEVFSIISPANDATVDSLTPTFQWNPAPNAVTYRVYVGRDTGGGAGTFATTWIKTGVTGTSIVYSGSELFLNTKYLFEMKAYDANGLEVGDDISYFYTPSN